MPQIDTVEFRTELLELIENDSRVRNSIAVLLGESAVLKELAALRKDMAERFEAMDKRFEAMEKRFEAMDKRFEAMDKRFEALRVDMDKRFEVLRVDMDKRFEAMEKRFEAMDKRFEALRVDMEKRFEALRADMDKGFKEFTKGLKDVEMRLDISIGGLGARWGIIAEASFKNAMRGLLTKRFGLIVDKWVYYDKEGFVNGKPRTIEVDLRISNSEHTLIEIKSSVSSGDVTQFSRIGALYQRVANVAPKLTMVTPYVRPEAHELASELNIEIFTQDYERQA